MKIVTQIEGQTIESYQIEHCQKDGQKLGSNRLQKFRK